MAGNCYWGRTQVLRLRYCGSRENPLTASHYATSCHAKRVPMVFEAVFLGDYCQNQGRSAASFVRPSSMKTAVIAPGTPDNCRLRSDDICLFCAAVAVPIVIGVSDQSSIPSHVTRDFVWTMLCSGISSRSPMLAAS